MNLNIREIAEPDLLGLSKLYVSVFAGEPWNEAWKVEWALDRLKTIFHSPGHYGLTAEVDRTQVAAAIGRSIPFKGRDEFELVEFFVQAEQQRKGVGKRLFTRLEAGLIENGCSRCVLLTDRGTDAERFYSDRGYRISERLVFMARDLSG